MKFLAHFLYSAFVFTFVAVVIYGINFFIGNAREIDKTALTLFVGMTLVISIIMGIAGAAGWLRRKE